MAAPKNCVQCGGSVFTRVRDGVYECESCLLIQGTPKMATTVTPANALRDAMDKVNVDFDGLFDLWPNLDNADRTMVVSMMDMVHGVLKSMVYTVTHKPRERT